MSTGQYHRVCRALLRSVHLSDTSSGDEQLGGQIGGNSLSSSVERQAMRDQLDAVRQTLNSLACVSQTNAAGVNAAAAGIDVALADIANKLASIEGLYVSLTNKLEKVDLRVEDSERHIKDLQHFSASAIHETARLVDYVGGRASTPPRNSSMSGAGSFGVPAAALPRARHSTSVPATPPPPGLSPSRSTVGILDHVPTHVNATIQQHAAQIHKVIAGLDFLEAHIIRQDQQMENLHKQYLSTARDVAASAALADSRSRPSELSVRVHDMGEMLDKLRAHMYKVEKKASSSDQALAALTQRLQVVEASAAPGGRSQQQPESLLELVTAQEELRGMVQDLCHDVLELRDQLQTPAPQALVSAPEVSAGEIAELRSQLSFLMSQVPILVTENKELKDIAAKATQQIDDLAAELDKQKNQLRQQQEHLHQVVSSAGTATAAADEVAEQLCGTMAALEEEVANLKGRLAAAAARTDLEALSSSIQAVERRRPSLETIVEMSHTLSAVQADVGALQERVTALEEAEIERAIAASRIDEEPLSVSSSPEPTDRALGAGLVGIVPAKPEAALLAAQVAAAAKADLEEQFGQLRHKLELASAAAEAAEVAARSSAEAAATAVQAATAMEQADKAAAAALQESVMSTVSTMKQEQCTLKQQVAQLAAQVSQEQAAISSGLAQLQEEVAVAATVAAEAVACAKVMQERESPREALNSVRAELREKVATVMEQLKERVQHGMQEIDKQMSAFSDRLDHAVSLEHLEDTVERLHAIAESSSERQDLTSASLEELRGQLILLTGGYDVMQSQMQGLECILGVDIRSSALGSAGASLSAPLATVEEADEEEEEEQDVDGAKHGADGMATCNGTTGSSSGGGRGLLDVVAELQSRVAVLEGTLEAGASDIGQLRDLMQSTADRTHDTIQQATMQLISDLQDLSALVAQQAASTAEELQAVDAASMALHQRVDDQAGATSELATRMTEVQMRLENEVVARVQETSTAVSSLSTRIARDYISREQLGAIFQARDNMKRAVDELASVFSTGRLLPTVSSGEDVTEVEQAAGGGVPRSNSGTLSPRLVSALADLAGKQAELEQQVQLALSRTEGVVRLEQLVAVQQALMTLEMQVRRLGTSGSLTTSRPPSSAGALPAAYCQAERATAVDAAPAAALGVHSGGATELSVLRARVEVLESVLAISYGPADTSSKEKSLPSESTIHMAVTPGYFAPVECSSSLARKRKAPAIMSAAQHGDSAPLPAAQHSEFPDSGTLALQNCEPSLSSMLHGRTTTADSSSSENSPENGFLSRDGLNTIASTRGEHEELRNLRAAVQELVQQSKALRSHVAVEGAERQRLAEELAELQERLDLQVTTTASTAAMVATMATDQSYGRVQFKVRVGPQEEDADGVAVLAAKVSMLAARVEAAEETLAAAFVVQMPRSLKRGMEQHQQHAEDTAGEASARDSGAAEPDEEEGSEEGLRPALGTMVPVTPREVEQQLVALLAEQRKIEGALVALVGRVDGLEAEDALEEVRAAASEAVLAAIPGMVSQQMAVVREEIEGIVARQGEQLMEVAGQAACDVKEVAQALQEVVVEAASLREAVESGLTLAGGGGAGSGREAAVEAARDVAVEVCMGLAREVAAEEMKDTRRAVEALAERMNDVDNLRDQLEALAAQVRDSMTVSAGAASGEGDPATAAAAATTTPGLPSSPTSAAAATVASIFTPAASAVFIPPARTPRSSVVASPPASAAQKGPSGSSTQQAVFLARLVDVVKRQSSRLHAQYSDAEETGAPLAQVEHTLEEAEARLADVRDVNSPAFTETLVTVLEQVAALRYIGSQTHPAVQQMVLEHENRLDKIADEIKGLSGGSPTRVSSSAAPLAEEVRSLSHQLARMEAELARVTGQQVALDRAIKDVLLAVGSIQAGSLSTISLGSLSCGASASARDRSRRSTAPDGEVLEELEAASDVEVADAAGNAPSASYPLNSVGTSLEMASLAAQVRLLESTLEVQVAGLRQEVMVELRSGRTGSGGGGDAGASGNPAGVAADLGDVERTVAKLHAAVMAIRNRLLAMQEYVDSTQGMIKDMHVALGGLHRRVDSLEASGGPSSRSTRVSGCGSISGASSDAGNLRELQVDLTKFERRLLTLESSSLDATHTLADLKGLVPRVSDTETRLKDACVKLAAALGGNASTTSPVIPTVPPGASLPAVAGGVRALERRLGGRVEAACGTLEALAAALAGASRIQAESTANPFKAISAAVNNPVIVALEKKLETVRADLFTAVTSLSEDMRRDLQQAQLESRLAAADSSVSGGNAFGGGGLTFRV